MHHAVHSLITYMTCVIKSSAAGNASVARHDQSTLLNRFRRTVQQNQIPLNSLGSSQIHTFNDVIDIA